MKRACPTPDLIDCSLLGRERQIAENVSLILLPVVQCSPFVSNQVDELCKGTTRPFLNQTILSSVLFPLPPLAEQRCIVSKIEALFAQADAIEAAVNIVRQRVDAKRVDQAIFARAFRGEL